MKVTITGVKLENYLDQLDNKIWDQEQEWYSQRDYPQGYTQNKLQEMLKRIRGRRQ